MAHTCALIVDSCLQSSLGMMQPESTHGVRASLEASLWKGVFSTSCASQPAGQLPFRRIPRIGNTTVATSSDC